MLKAIIFDFDGVLGDTYQINYQTTQLFDPKVNAKSFSDHHMGNVFEEPKIKFQPQDIPLYFAKTKEIFTKNHFFPVIKIIPTLQKDYQLFIISSTVDVNLHHFLSLVGLEKYFQAIWGSSTHRSKQEKFKMLFDKYDLLATECIFVTDTVGDIKEARSVGVNTIAVTWGFHSPELLEQYHPLAIVTNEQELLEKILAQK